MTNYLSGSKSVEKKASPSFLRLCFFLRNKTICILNRFLYPHYYLMTSAEPNAIVISVTKVFFYDLFERNEAFHSMLYACISAFVVQMKCFKGTYILILKTHAIQNGIIQIGNSICIRITLNSLFHRFSIKSNKPLHEFGLPKRKHHML